MGDGKEKISDNARNALSELGNIGAGNAATSLSVLLSTKLVMSPPHVDIYDFNALENIVGGPDATVVGVLSLVSGDMDAMLLFILGVEDAKNLVGQLMGDSTDWSSEMGMSAINEIANILIGSYVASLETLSGLKIRYGQPSLCIDMAGSILSVPCIEFAKISDKALLINSQFIVGDKEINGFIMMVSEMHSYDVLLNKLGIGGING
ncbi:MAG: chemotaxis protein CheC [Clostridium sp.]|nr:chemotaxis protein CheC [Clostridium sp.]MCM1397983.1 chemotaxis protein CheC [Clostridium sp.]MCM1459381.1 chemotaxis protein CheC [Bacteroides sp.]